MTGVALSVAQVTCSMEQAQLALAAKRLQLNADFALEVARQNMVRAINLAPGVGGNLDVRR
jgi:hypothetical protein